ncbi:MAG: hypothetical protein WC454_10410 [Phycisphaerae bacterium]|jgi:hypothetical protein
MSETEKKDEGQKCCCCQCFKAIVLAIVLLVIGAAIGHVLTMKCCPMMGPWGGSHGMKMCSDKGGMERECCLEHKMRGEKEVCGKDKGWLGQKADAGKCKPGCTCPMCSKKGADLSEPDKSKCPMAGKKEGKPEKDQK